MVIDVVSGHSGLPMRLDYQAVYLYLSDVSEQLESCVVCTRSVAVLPCLLHACVAHSLIPFLGPECRGLYLSYVITYKRMSASRTAHVQTRL